MDTTPERFGRLSAPWPPPPAPGPHPPPQLALRLYGPGAARLSTTFAVFHRVAFASRIPASGIGHSLAFDSLRRVKSATSSGMDATPVLFRPIQCPLVASLLHQAPVRLIGLGSIFHNSRCFPSVAFTSRHPLIASRPSTCFRFATPCEVGDIPQVWMLPLRYSGQHSAPWPPSSCARLLHPSS